MPRESKQELVEALIYELRAAEAANDAFDVVANEKLGLNDTDGRALSIIDNEKPITAGRLAQIMGLTTAAVTAVLDRLEKAGYARRVRDENDRRKVMIELTPRIEERGEEIWGPLGEDARKELSRMTIDELKTMIDYFRRARSLNARHVDRIRALNFD